MTTIACGPVIWMPTNGPGAASVTDSDGISLPILAIRVGRLPEVETPGRVGLLLWVGMRDVSRQSRIVDKVIVCDRFMSICFMKATVVVSDSPVTFLRNNRRLPRQSGRSARATVREPRVCAACSHHEL